MLLGELWWAQSAGAIPGNPLRAFVSVAVAMFLDASGFHAGSFAPALSSRKVHPVYRLHLFFQKAQLYRWYRNRRRRRWKSMQPKYRIMREVEQFDRVAQLGEHLLREQVVICHAD